MEADDPGSICTRTALARLPSAAVILEGELQCELDDARTRADAQDSTKVTRAEDASCRGIDAATGRKDRPDVADGVVVICAVGRRPEAIHFDGLSATRRSDPAAQSPTPLGIAPESRQRPARTFAPRPSLHPFVASREAGSDAADCCIQAIALIGPSVKASTGLASVNELRSRNSRFLTIRTFQPTPYGRGRRP